MKFLYLFSAHWQLLILCPGDNLVVWFCPLRKKPDAAIKNAVNRVMFKQETTSVDTMLCTGYGASYNAYGHCSEGEDTHSGMSNKEANAKFMEAMYMTKYRKAKKGIQFLINGSKVGKILCSLSPFPPMLNEAIEVMKRAAPLILEEVSLLNDAVSQIDEPFLLVIVGEFNSGKSTVINALLGERYLKEITFLRYTDLDIEQQHCERHPDGQYICYIPAPILKERQQRLTEEFVPRADLLLFVIFVDRPLTGSEVWQGYDMFYAVFRLLFFVILNSGKRKQFLS
ncbi:hypothetical protein JHK87_050356 [Glycine soja]|nr:hypothetical protein JHK87_050356 [Glycine soja]